MNRPAIVMVHGMWGSGKIWAPFRNWFLEQGYAVHTPTLRHHHPDSDPGNVGKTSLREYVADLEDYINTLDQPPILMGHSMGGLLVQLLAARGLGRALILFNSAAPAGINSLRPIMLPGVGRFFLNWGFWRKPYMLSLWEARYALFNGFSGHEAERRHKKMVPESGRAGSEIVLWFLDPGKASRLDFKAVTCPILFLTGKDDRVTPKTVCRANAARYPDHQIDYLELEGKAHWPHLEPGWEAVATRCDRWINTCAAPLAPKPIVIRPAPAQPARKVG